MSTYTCEGCGETTSLSSEEAFNLGWDVPPYFTFHVTCPKCPITKTKWYAAYMKTVEDSKK